MLSKNRRKNPAIILFSVLILSGAIIGRSGIPWDVLALVSLVLCGFMVIQSNLRILAPASIFLIMSTWSALNQQMFEIRDLMVYTGYDADPILVHMEGRIIRIRGTRIDLDTRSSFEEDIGIPVTGRIVVRLPRPSEILGPGDIIQVKGWLHGIQAPRDSEPDWRTIAIDGDYRGWMRLESMDLIHIKRIQKPGIWNSLKSHAEDRILSQPVPSYGSNRTILAGLLLGARGDSWNEISDPFRRTGVSHLLAISGLHVSLVLFMFMPLIGVGGVRRRWHSLFAITILFIYLSIIDIRTPIMRAGIMSAFFYLPLTVNMRIPVKGVLAFTMSLILICEPNVPMQISFQLSFGVVASLVLLSPHVHRRCFPHVNRRISGPFTFAIMWIQRSFTASMVAWLISIPITIHHFGQISLVSVPMTMIMTPLVCVILLTASIRLLFGDFEFVSQLMGNLLAKEVYILESFAETVAGIPFVSIENIQSSTTWTTLAILWAVSWCLIDRWRFLLFPSLLGLIIWISILNFSG